MTAPQDRHYLTLTVDYSLPLETETRLENHMELERALRVALGSHALQILRVQNMDMSHGRRSVIVQGGTGSAGDETASVACPRSASPPISIPGSARRTESF